MAKVALNVGLVVAAAVRIKAAGGNLDAVCREFFPDLDSERDDAAWKAAKQQLSQIMTTTRKLVMEGLIKRGKTEQQAEELALKAVPTFRDGRSTVKGTAVNSLIDGLLSQFDDKESDDAEYADAENTDETVTA